MTESRLSCVLCGSEHSCRADAACWCMAADADESLTRWLTEQGLADRCLCANCLAGRVPSPCRSICELVPGEELCGGCGRTLDEIGRWGLMSVPERAAVWLRLKTFDAQ